MHFFLYNESLEKNFRINSILEYLREKLPGVETALGELLPRAEKEVSTLAAKYAKLRVLDPFKPFKANEPLPGELDFEERVIRGDASPVGVLYDGFRLQELYLGLIPRGQRGLDNLHIVFTDRFFGTYDENDLRYHGRVVILGYPTLISITGLVEAPAKPREYYLARRLGGSEEEIKKTLEGRFIDYGDTRMTEVLKGYVMQGVFYHLTGEAFCDSEDCGLYNAHWQEEVLRAQLSEKEFCEKHEKMLLRLRKSVSDP